MATRPARRGRPPKAQAGATRHRLLDAAAATCAERGYDGASLHEIARRAGVTATAVYNHFGSREELLQQAGQRGLERMTEAVGPGDDLAGVALSYLRPEMAATRRLLAELHLAGRRHAELGALLEGWHRAEAGRLARLLPPGDAPEARLKVLFLLLLGLCHLDALDAVEADPDAVAARVAALATAAVT